MALRKSFKVHVTFGDSKRILTLNKGEGVPELRYNFLREFSEELSDEVPPTNIKFQRYNDTFNDYEDLKPDAKLTENVKLLANCTKINAKNMDFMRSQNPYCGERSLEIAVHQRENHDHQMARCIALCGPVCFSSIPWYPILHSSQFKKGTYKLWNPVKNGVIMFETNKSSVFTNGQLGPTDAERNGEYAHSKHIFVKPARKPAPTFQVEYTFYFGSRLIHHYLEQLGPDGEWGMSLRKTRFKKEPYMNSIRTYSSKARLANMQLADKIFINSEFQRGELQADTVTGRLYGQDLYNLCYTGSPDQYISAAATGTEISLTPNNTVYARFEAIYNGSYTMFRCNSRSTGNTGMYLGCNEGNNNAALVPVDELYKYPGDYPDPRTLFIITKIKTSI